MLYPPMSELLKHVDSRYLLVNVVARKAREMASEAEELGQHLLEVTKRYGRANWDALNAMEKEA